MPPTASALPNDIIIALTEVGIHSKRLQLLQLLQARLFTWGETNNAAWQRLGRAWHSWLPRGGPLRSFPLSWKHRHRAPESLETHRLAGKAPSRSGFVRSTAPRYELIIQSGVIQEQLRSSCKMNSLLVKQCQARQRRL